jgi:hypothetical protein
VTPVALSQLLLLLTSFALAALLWLMLLIARFYARFAGEKTYHRLFLLPIALFGIAAVRYSSIDRIAGDALADVVMAAAGISLAILSLRLYRQMTLHKSAS